jgi:hypothetical protein
MGVVINDPQNSQVRADEKEAHEAKEANIRALEEIREGLEEEITNELDSIMQQVKDLAISLCPKDTGALASSISLESGAISSGDFYGSQIYAGSEDIINPISGKPTSEYAGLVHEGHALRDGSFYEGTPFLTDALSAFENELEECVSRALKELSGD